MEGIAPVLELATHGQVFVVLIVCLSRRGVVAEENAWEQTCLIVDDSFLFFLGGKGLRRYIENGVLGIFRRK
jgi:hypothetical protein